MMRRNLAVLLSAAVLVMSAAACGSDDDDNGNGGDDGGNGNLPDVSDAIEYRSLSSHPGCTTADLTYTAATIPGFQCAAKEYTETEDTTKPIVLMVHGNSDTPASWEAYSAGGACPEVGATEGQPRLAEQLAAAGFKVLALDMRMDKVDDPAANNETENAAKNMDHGWGTPLAQHFIQSAMEAWPDRRFVIVGFSFGTTVVRDALRRLYINEDFNAFERIDHAFLLAGANHGVSSFALCGVNPTMRGQVTCEMGDRAAYSPTPFLAVLNGPNGTFETPCGDGATAFGREDACGGNEVEYTTIVMQDKEDGEQQDLFVSEASAHLQGADNRTIGLEDYDTSNYFFCGLFKNHYGAARSDAALAIMGDKLGF